MTLKLHIPDNIELKPRLTVFGVGGAGGNAVNNMISRSLEGVDFVVANTDAQALALNDAPFKIQLGEELTEGLGAGAKPEVGAGAAEESLERIVDVLKGSHMCFITAGMGGGTGTGAAPVIAQAARELGILTIGVVTKPFSFEGGRRMKLAEEGIKELQQYVDTLIIIPNQNLFLLANENTTFSEAFGLADDVLYQGVKGVTDLMVLPGLVNLDFADIRSVMDEMGKAMMGTGEAEGADRAVQAAERAIDNPLLDEISLKGARGVLINITGGQDMSLFEVDEASNKIREMVDEDANIIFGATLDQTMEGRMRVSVVATGIEAEEEFIRPIERIETSNFSGAEISQKQTQVSENADLDKVSVQQATQEPDLFGELPTETQSAGFEGSNLNTHEIGGEEIARDDFSSAYEAQIAQARPQPMENASQLAPSAPQMSVQQPSGFMGNAFQQNPAPVKESVIDRLQRVASRKPATAVEAQSGRVAASNSQPVAPKEPIAEKARFGLDSVIRKMSGNSSAQGEKNVPETPKPADITQSQPSAPQLGREEQERVDIPAFLRRQAN